MIKYVLTLLTLLCSCFAFTQEIAQWRGPDRNGIYPETGLVTQWPEEGPEMIWHFDELGDGHASAAVSDEVVYTAGMIDDIGYIYAFDHTGNLLWKSEYGKEWTESYAGSRSTPLLYDNKLFIMSAFGELVCMTPEAGDVLWRVDLMEKYEGENIRWGATENLAFLDDMVFCTPGGKEYNVIALDKDSGDLIWKCEGKKEVSAYCSPLVFKHGGRNTLVTMTASFIIGIDTKSGKMLWSHYQPNEWSVHANTPVYKDGFLYCVSGYGKGGVMLKLSENGKEITEMWRNGSLDNRMGGVVEIDGKIYGGGDSRKWVCLDWETGNEVYASKMLSKGTIISAEGLFYCYDESGRVALVEPEETDFNLISVFKVPLGKDQHWAHLVIHEKRLYVRHGTSLMVYDIAAE